MGMVTCPHCAQQFNNYASGIKATKCPRCTGKISYINGTPIINKNILINHFWKIIIFFSLMSLIGGIVEGNKWYEILGLMIVSPIIVVSVLYFLSGSGPEYLVKDDSKD
jgi:hypothetical protein